MGVAQGEVIDTPEVKRRLLKAALRREREAAGLSQNRLDALDWSVSKIIRIETGAVGLTVTDLRALMDQYKITDEQRQDELIELARSSRKQSWSEYSDVYDVPARTLFGYEAAAKTIYKYEPTFIPGLLQTEEYATAVLRAVGHTDHEIERMVRGRLERQELLDKGSRPELQFILGEAAVSRVVGGPGVMHHQLERLKDLAARPRISLQILPFEVGAHPRIGSRLSRSWSSATKISMTSSISKTLGKNRLAEKIQSLPQLTSKISLPSRGWLSQAATSPRQSTRSRQCGLRFRPVPKSARMRSL